MRTAQPRVLKYNAKTHAQTVGLKVAAQLTAMRPHFAQAVNSLTHLEQQVQGLLNSLDIPTRAYPYYLNFARQLWALYHRGIRGDTLAAQAAELRDRWTDRGLVAAHIELISFAAEQVWIPAEPLPVPGFPSFLLYVEPHDEVYCGDEGGDTVTVFHGTTREVIATITVGNTPGAAAYNPTSDKVYVANFSDNTVSVIDAGSHTVLATPATGTGPIALCHNPTNNQVYCPNRNSNNVTVIDGATNAVITTVAVGTTPFAAVHLSTSNKVFVSNYGANTVSVIDGATNAVVATPAVGTSPTSIIAVPSHNEVYVTCIDSDNVKVIDGTSNAVSATIAVGTFPDALRYISTLDEVAVANVGSGSVSFINAVSHAVAATTNFGTALSSDLIWNATSAKLYVADTTGTGIGIIDAGHALIATISQGDMPNRFAFVPTTNKVWCSVYLGSIIVVIDGQYDRL